jgi:ubiquinone/menaquinone biosynthesis C-methylase UbiE
LATIDFQLRELVNYKNILDSGAGSGNLTLKLLKEGKQVTAIDFNQFALNILRKKCREYSDNLTIARMNVESLDFEDEQFNGASSMFVISFVKDNKKYFSEIYRVLKPNGKFVISSWAAVPDTWQGIMEVQKKELENKGILPKHQAEWDYVMESAKIAVNDVIKGPDLNKIKRLLKEVGFKNIRDCPNPYNKYAYFLTCEK